LCLYSIDLDLSYIPGFDPTPERDTFIRFCQFACTGDYVTSDFALIPTTELPYVSDRYTPAVEVEKDPEPVPEESLDPPALDAFDWASRSKKPKKIIQPSKNARLRQSLNTPTYDTKTSRAILIVRCDIRPNSNPTEEYTQVFLGYAELYFFAEKWGIDVLKTLTLSKLHQTLTSFKLYAARRPDIVELL
jgi:hypothetical protein